MHALQHLGETLVGLSAARLEMLGLPEQLLEALEDVRRMNQHEARRRQMQFIGRLMRDIDPAPIEAKLARWREPANAEKARTAAAERWRSRLLAEAGALDELCRQVPQADRRQLSALATRAADERAHGTPPHAYRELFRVLNGLL
jgi:ribosome-associated protein